MRCRGVNDSNTLHDLFFINFYLFKNGENRFLYNIFNNHMNWEEVDGKEMKNNCFHSLQFCVCVFFFCWHEIRFGILANISTQNGTVFKSSQILEEFEFRSEEQIEQLKSYFHLMFVLSEMIWAFNSPWNWFSWIHK